MGILLRSVIRQHFGIGPMSYWVTCWDGMLEDCLLATFCSCCSAIQIARHTHDEDRYPYTAGSPDGLSSYAPNMWSMRTFLDTSSPSSPTANGGGEAEMAASPYRSNLHHRSPTSSNNNSNSSTPMANVEIV